MATIEAIVVEPLFAAYIDSILASPHCYNLHLNKLAGSLTDGPWDRIMDIVRHEQPTFDRLFDSHLRLLEQHARSLPLSELSDPPRTFHTLDQRQTPRLPRRLLGMMLHKHIISTAAADAVRNRRPLVTCELGDWVRTHKSSAPVEVLSVACGPAHEIADMFKDQADFRNFRIALLDQDAEALGEAQQEIRAAETRCSGKVDVRYVKKSIGALLRPGLVRDGLGKFDFIYSMGLYDYLDERTAKKLTDALFDMLKSSGVLLLGNYSKTNPTRYYLEYWCDWPLE